MKLKLLVTLLVAILLLGGCTPTDTNIDIDIPTPDDEYTDEPIFSIPNIDMQSTILKIENNDVDITGSIDHEWLMWELNNCIEVSRPTEVIALDMTIKITLDSGQELSLNLRDPYNNKFSLKIDKTSYSLYSENITLWLDYLSIALDFAWSARGTVGEIDAENNRFMLINAVDNCDMIWFTLSSDCNTNISNLMTGDRVVVMIDGGIAESYPAQGGTSCILSDTSPQSAGTLNISGDGQYSEELESKASIIVMVSNQSFDVPEAKISGSVNGLEFFNETYDVETQHAFYFYYVSAAPGVYVFDIQAEGVSITETVKIEDGQPLWIAFTYWNGDNQEEMINVFSQNERIVIV